MSCLAPSEKITFHPLIPPSNNIPPLWRKAYESPTVYLYLWPRMHWRDGADRNHNLPISSEKASEEREAESTETMSVRLCMCTCGGISASQNKVKRRDTSFLCTNAGFPLWQRGKLQKAIRSPENIKTKPTLGKLAAPIGRVRKVYCSF